MPKQTKSFACLLCGKPYMELEDAEVCEQSHTKPGVTTRHDDDDYVPRRLRWPALETKKQ